MSSEPDVFSGITVVSASVSTIAVLSAAALLAVLVPGIRAATIPRMTVLQQ